MVKTYKAKQAALTAAGFGITVLCGTGGSGSHGKSSGSTQTEGKTDDSDARTEDAAVGNREDGDAAISSKTDGNDTFNVVTSFYPVYIAAKNVIGDVEGVELHNLTEPQTGCLHDYQLTPQDMISLSHADLFLVNGGGIESFLSDVFTSYPELPVAEASEGIDFLETVDGQVYDAHDAGTGQQQDRRTNMMCMMKETQRDTIMRRIQTFTKVRMAMYTIIHTIMGM